jgi:hypothetical protein
VTREPDAHAVAIPKADLEPHAVSPNAPDAAPARRSVFPPLVRRLVWRRRREAPGPQPRRGDCDHRHRDNEVEAARLHRDDGGQNE